MRNADETPRLEVRNGRVIKRYPADELEEARDKYSLLLRVERSKEILLVTPSGGEPLDGALAFPEVRGLEPIRSVLFGTHTRQACDIDRVIDLCAKGLAQIHAVPLEGYAGRGMAAWSHPNVDPREDDGGPVLLHGDFGFSNLFVLRGAHQGAIRRLVIIDAEANGYFTSRHLQAGARYVDLALMTSCLLGRLGSWRSIFVARETCKQYVCAFAARYELHAGFKVSLPRLRDYTCACVRSYFARRFANSLLTSLASDVLLERFRLISGEH